MSLLIFRLMTPRDLDAVVSLVNSAYRGDTARLGWTTEADVLDGQRIDIEGLDEILRDSDQEVWLAETGPSEKDPQLVGCFHLSKVGPLVGSVGMVTVRPQIQARGLGRQLLGRAEERGREKGWREMEMTVLTLRTALIEFYQRRGYQVTEERRPFPSDPRFGIPRVAKLEFLVMKKSLDQNRET